MTLHPTPCQQQMVDFLIEREHAMLAAGMGLGKTGAVLTAITNHIIDGKARGALIIAPKRVMQLTWPMEIAKWSNFGFLRVISLRDKEGITAWKKGIPAIYLANYDIIDKLSTVLFTSPPPVEILVWDEITKAKNPTSKRVNKFRKFRSQFTYHWGLTGTLMSEGYMDMFAPYRLLDGGQRLGTVFHQFRARYFESDYMGFKFTPRDFARDAITKKTEDMTLILRRQDHLDIPDTFVVDEDVSMPPDSQKLYRKMERDMLVEMGEDFVTSPNAAALVGKLQQLTSGAVYDEDRNVLHVHDAKVKAAKDLHDKFKEPIIFFTSFIHERNRILRAIPGAMEFSEDIMGDWDAGDIPAIVADPRSIGHGLNLQKPCRRVVWVSLTYSRDLYDQANARVARTGQGKETFVHRLMCPGTIDWAVAEALRSKEEEQQTLFTIWRSLKNMNS